MPHLDSLEAGQSLRRPPVGSSTGYRSDAAADRFMRRLLGVTRPQQQSSDGAHGAFRTAVILSGIRCLITYLVIPVVVPLLALGGWVAAPIGIALCVFAVINGIVSLQRFWRSDHPKRWMYTIFMAVVFVILAVALVADFSRLGAL